MGAPLADQTDLYASKIIHQTGGDLCGCLSAGTFKGHCWTTLTCFMLAFARASPGLILLATSGKVANQKHRIAFGV